VFQPREARLGGDRIAVQDLGHTPRRRRPVARSTIHRGEADPTERRCADDAPT
jgi:hypothetical protein